MGSHTRTLVVLERVTLDGPGLSDPEVTPGQGVTHLKYDVLRSGLAETEARVS